MNSTLASVARLAPITCAPPPVSGESIVSWFARLAAANQMPAGWIPERVGVTHGTGTADQPVGLITGITPDQATRMHITTSVPVQVLHAMTLARYQATIYGQFPTTPAGSVDHRLLALDQWIHLRGAPYCPACLADNEGAHLLAWRIPFTYACTTHGCLLVAECPTCRQAPHTGHPSGILRATFTTHIPTPGLCDGADTNSTGKGSTPCGTNLTDIPTVTLPDEWITVQQRITNRMNDPALGNPGWFADLRALTAAVLAVGTLDQADRLNGTLPLPTDVAAQWRTFTDRRETRRDHNRTAALITGVDHRTGGRQRWWQTTPNHPTLTAPAVVLAEHALTGDDDVLWAIISTRIPGSRAVGYDRLTAFNPSATLIARCKTVIDAHANTSRRNGYHQRTAQPSPVAGLAHDGIPPLLWADEYEAHIAPLIDAANTAAAGEGRPEVPVNETTLRRLASVALHKQLTAGTWHTSAEHFADQIARNKNVANATLDRLKKHTPRLADLYLTAIAALAGELEADPGRMQAYPELRRAADVVLGGPVPGTVYAGLGDGGRVTVQRRTYAAAWAWAFIVDDHPWNAPVWGDTPPTESDRDLYHRWTLTDLPAVEAALRAWARDTVTAPQRGSAA